jgi:hypothetical protein
MVCDIRKTLYYSYSSTHIIFLSLLLIELTSLPIYSFHSTGGDSHEDDFANKVNHDLSVISIPRITAKSDTDSIAPHHPIDEVHPDNLEKTVRDLASFHTRHTESTFIDDVAYWLTMKLQSICGRGTYVHDFTYIPDKADVDSEHRQQPPSYYLKNIVCEKPGLTNNTIIISAHYDNRMEDINNSTARAPGADDDASGVSALLEVARILSKIDLEHSIHFVLFSGEEQGKWGSREYADHIDETDVDLDLLINLDMIGFPSHGTNNFLIEYDNGNAVQDNDKHSHTVCNFIKGLASRHTNLNATLGVLGSADYLPFEALGYTVIGFHDDGVTKNPNYHKTSDTPDTLDYEYLSSVAKLTLATILSLGELTTADSIAAAAGSDTS